MALAYFITFSTHGTWLHGTEKVEGSVDRRHNIYGTPLVTANEPRKARAESLMSEPPYVLSEAARKIVCDAIIGLCREKGWALLGLHVRTNHVHAVMSAEREPGRLESDLKARASRELNRAGVDAQEKRWTRHGSTRHLFDAESVACAVSYTLDEQGEPMEIYDSRKEPRKS
jgi:REP element-mobilizing transposase RayT